MKISKLFHWLYACLMFAPFFAILCKCLYTLNPNAKDSYYGETINEKIETQIININDFTSGEYKFNNNLLALENTNGTFRIYIHDFESASITLNQVCTHINFYSYPNGDEVTKMYCAFYNNNTLLASRELQNSSILFYCYIDSYTYTNQSYSYFIDSFYKISYNNYSYIDNVFYYAVDEVKNEPLFSWANDSFINQPMTYIGGLFGLQSDSAIYTLLSYWLSISIIWLTFDLLMYVPLLVHRWIDKGVLE